MAGQKSSTPDMPKFYTTDSEFVNIANLNILYKYSNLDSRVAVSSNKSIDIATWRYLGEGVTKIISLDIHLDLISWGYRRIFFCFIPHRWRRHRTWVQNQTVSGVSTCTTNEQVVLSTSWTSTECSRWICTVIYSTLKSVRKFSCSLSLGFDNIFTL